MNRRTLGRGLSALLGGYASEEGTDVADQLPAEGTSAGGIFEVPVGSIDPNPYQPRVEFDTAELDGLADSIRAHGILQPVVVRPMGDRFQLVAGERRLRAAQHLGWHTVPARLVELDDQQTCELALVENLQRKDLNAIEKAHAFQRYIEQFHAKHEDLARQIGIDRSTVTNLLRLLELPDAVQQMVIKSQISNGHARAILSIEDPISQLTVAQEVVDKGLSVRQTEALVREQRSAPPQEAPPAPPAEQQPAAQESGHSNHVESIKNEIRQKLGIKVDIRARGTEGEIVLHFGSNDDFERIVEQLRR